MRPNFFRVKEVLVREYGSYPQYHPLIFCLQVQTQIQISLTLSPKLPHASHSSDDLYNPIFGTLSGFSPYTSCPALPFS